MVPDAGWIAAQRLASARAMRGACSATGLMRARAGFGWRVQPAAGSVLASKRAANWDPEPDYFYHWVRDSAIVLRAVPRAIAADPGARAFWMGFIADFVGFSLAISDPDRVGPRANPLHATVRPDFAKYVRPDAELAALTGDAWQGEPRVTPDGTPDLEQWSRPQDDGPALRASALMGVIAALPEAASAAAQRLIARDLAYVQQVAGRPCIGPWEETPARRTTFTMMVQWDALERGGAADAADRLVGLIAQAEDAVTGGWRESIEAAPGHLDCATILAILHAGRAAGPYAMTGPRVAATVAALEAQFAALYPINRGANAVAIGRWAQDVYFEGNPWFPATLGFAELHYRIAAATGDRAAFAKAEGWTALIERVAPRPPGPLPEQFDARSGAPASCLDLTWSAAAFLEAAHARDMAIDVLR